MGIFKKLLKNLENEEPETMKSLQKASEIVEDKYQKREKLYMDIMFKEGPEYFEVLNQFGEDCNELNNLKNKIKYEKCQTSEEIKRNEEYKNQIFDILRKHEI